MFAIILAAIESLFLRSSDAVQNVIECPNGCYCSLTSSNTSLTINCGNNHPDIDVKQLSRLLDSMLSADHAVERLTSLTITNTSLTRVPTFVCQLLNLRILILDRNKLTELPDNCFTKLTKLSTISMKYNSIVGLQDGVFDGLQSLVTLDLSLNQIAFIGLRVFSNASDLISLRQMNLDYNRLTSLEPWWYYRCILGNESSPVHITLKHNMIANFTNRIHFDFRCGMKKPYGYLDLHGNRITHLMDVYRGWNIGEMGELLCLVNIRGHFQMKVNLGGHRYACDCTDFYFYKLIKAIPNFYSHVLDGVRCSGRLSTGMQSEYAFSIPLNEFVCKLSDGCPSSCRCVYRPANATLHVNCSASNLSSLPLDLPPLPKSYVRYKLDFSKNKLLRRLEYRSYFVNTSILDVSNCGLNDIDLEVWLEVSHMKIVNFRGNMIQAFPRDVNTRNISTSLLLGGNPWRCSCDNSWMIVRFHSLWDHIADQGDIICRTPSRMYGRNVLKSTEEDFCADPVKRTLTIAVSTVASISFLVVLTGVLVYKLRVKFYRRWKFHPFDRDECVGEDMDYDVFLCCSSKDYDPHGQHILELIESNDYRVCYHDRDFLPGSLISANMTESVERSKRTLCLLSNNFLQR